MGVLTSASYPACSDFFCVRTNLFDIELSEFHIPYPFIIYIFCNSDFQFVYRIVLGSSKRAKEEICNAELKAEQRPSMTAKRAVEVFQASWPKDTWGP